MIKGFAFFMLVTLPLAAQWYTATSVTVGTKYISEFSAQSMDIRAEQYFINDAMPKLYYKAGYFQEQLYRWSLSDGTTFTDSASNVLFGVGYNVITLGKFFIDGGLSGAYQLGQKLIEGSISGVNYTSDYGESVFTPFADVGIGFSFGSWSIKADILYAVNSEATLINSQTNETIQTTPYGRMRVNMGVAFWW